MKQLMQLNVCVSGKKSFQNEEHAAGAVERYASKFGVDSRVYLCPLCRQFHLTTSRHKRRKNRGFKFP